MPVQFAKKSWSPGIGRAFQVHHRRGARLGVGSAPVMGNINSEQLAEIRKFIDVVLERAFVQLAIIQVELGSLYGPSETPIPSLAGFTPGELKTQVYMDARELKDALIDFSNNVRNYPSQEEVIELSRAIKSLQDVENAILLGEGSIISNVNKLASVNHMKDHVLPVVEATREMAARIASIEGSVGAPIGQELPAEGRPVSTTIAEESSGFPWWILLVAGGAWLVFK